MKKAERSIPIIDIFAGPGGLGEGFSAFKSSDGHNPFKIVLSIEKDPIACETLELRSFFRQFKNNEVPDDYYQFLRGNIKKAQLFERFPTQYINASNEVLHAELGSYPEQDLKNKIKEALKGSKFWVLIGGPPCQAYSIVGRARRGGIKASDPNTKLYVEYLKILSAFKPSIFIMENVKGLLSSKLGKNKIFDEIYSHLQNPASFFNSENNSKKTSPKYQIHSLVKNENSIDLFDKLSPLAPSDFIIKCENYGIPQARHRVILMGINKDKKKKPEILIQKERKTVKEVISDLPELRSGISRNKGWSESWQEIFQKIQSENWINFVKEKYPEVFIKMIKTSKSLQIKREKRGDNFVPNKNNHQTILKTTLDKWLKDKRLKGTCNHSTRGHMPEDLYRYLFASCFAKEYGYSPKLSEFPKKLLPKHKNINEAMNGAMFSDRFKVQIENKPSSTVTSHISKDGHYFIHPDPNQCRSLTVREAARLQTFPDNYYFCGPRTSQYVQVGNAVPPYLACQIAEVIYKYIQDS